MDNVNMNIGYRVKVKNPDGYVEENAIFTVFSVNHLEQTIDAVTKCPDEQNDYKLNEFAILGYSFNDVIEPDEEDEFIYSGLCDLPF